MVWTRISAAAVRFMVTKYPNSGGGDGIFVTLLH